MSFTSFTRRLLVIALAALALVPVATASADAPIARLKQMQIRRLLAEPMQERAERNERKEHLRELAKALKKSGKHALVQKGLRAKPMFETDAPDGSVSTGRLTHIPLPANVNAPPSANVRVNNPVGDAASDGQCETSLVAYGNYMLAAWNDGSGFTDLTNDSQGWATSIDGGLTWTDQGKLPKPGSLPSLVWTSDPVLAVNSNTGAFYYSGLCDPTNLNSLSGIGVIKGRFNGSGVFAWSTPSVVRQVNASSDFLDKQWIAVDPSTGKVYLTYTWFPPGSSQINVQAADSNATSWTAAVLVSQVGEAGRVQGSRPVVAPNGNLFILYYLIGTVDVDFMMVAKSTNGGLSIASRAQATSFYTNYGSGAPGFNRTTGIQFGGITVERSSGPHNGRLWVIFPESLNWYDDEPSIGTGGFKPESDAGGTANNTAATANAFTVGQVLEGTMATTADVDFYKTTLTAGQSILAESDSVASGLTAFIRCYASDGTTRLALSSADNATGTTNPSVWLFTAPSTGTYYIRVTSAGGSGAYRVKTGAASRTIERGRDQRDIFATYSDDGATWSTPVQVNTSAVGFDDWLPEIAVAADPTNGTHGDRVYATWYDFRDATASTCGGQSSIYLARSDDGGASWNTLGPTSDALSSWTSVASNIQPNQGDYHSLYADGNQVVVCWGDGRDGNPNVYMSRWTLIQTPTAISLGSAQAFRDHVALTWNSAGNATLSATVYRGQSGVWTALGVIEPTAEGTLTFTDASVTPGETYDYRLGLSENGVERFYGQTTVTVPSRVSFALEGASPNPATGAARIAFSLAGTERATLALLDIGGRVIESQDVTSLGAGRHVLTLGATRALRPGVYLARLTKSDGVSLTRRVSVVR